MRGYVCYHMTGLFRCMCKDIKKYPIPNHFVEYEERKLRVEREMQLLRIAKRFFEINQYYYEQI